MFKLKQGGHFRWPVKFSWPDNGRFVERQFDVTFKRVQTDAINRASKDIRDGDAMSQIARFLDDVVVAVHDIELTDANDQPITDPEQMRQAMLAEPTIALAMYAAFTEALAGGVDREAARKNSPAPRST